MADFKIVDSIEKQTRVLNKVCCAIEALDQDNDTELLQSILEAILENTAENENNLQCSISKACDAGTCEVITCKICTDVEGTTVSTELYVGGVWIPDTDFTGTLDLGCLSCGEPIPTYEIINIPVCYESCVPGYTLIKVNTLTDDVTPLGNYYSDGAPSTELIVPCSEFKILESEGCTT